MKNTLIEQQMIEFEEVYWSNLCNPEMLLSAGLD